MIAFERVRRLCLSFPGAYEKKAWGVRLDRGLGEQRLTAPRD